jgi:serine/threonine-protein kinase
VFEAGHPVQVLMQHVNRQPETPSHRTELPVPPELDALILDLLQKEKEARPASAADVVARLDAIPLERPWDGERAQQWWDRHHPPRPWPKRATPLEGAVHTSLVRPLDVGTDGRTVGR